jgi:hypothetical protein
MSMARTLGGDSNQVAKPGRRTLVGWGSAAYTFQTLLQDITLAGTPDAPFLKQSFIPELSMLRESAGTPETSQQFEVLATLSKPSVGEVAPFVSTESNSSLTPWQCTSCAYFTVLGHTKIGIDFESELVFVDTSAQLLKWKSGKLAPNSGVRAGPLYGDPSQAVHVHAYVDHCIIAVIANNRTALTVAVTPDEKDGGVQAGPGTHVSSWSLKDANENAQKTPDTPWLLPKVHNAPACL